MPLMLIALAFFLVKGPSDAVGTMDNSFLRIEEGFFHDFGSQNSGVTVSAALTLRNDGTENATSLSFLALSTPFSWTGGSFPGNGGDCGASLSGGASCLLDVSFTPSASGSFSEFLSASYTYDGSSEEVVINLVGVGTDTGGLSISESPFFSFPVVAIGENENHVFTITNTTTSTDASSLLISGLSAPFTFNGGSFPGTNGNCGSSLLGSQSCDIDILFSPTFEDVFQDTMTISYVMNSAAKSIELPIDGAGKNLTDVSILSAPDILFNNATAYEISGGCSENGQEVTLDIGGLTPSPQPTCTLGQWQLSAFDASSLANGNVIITADHEDTFGNMADQATVTVLRSDVVPPEAIVDLYVPASDFESVDLSWTSPADNGTAITDYIIEFKEYDDTTWQTFADGLSTATSTTVTGLNSSTLYQFRVFAVNVPTGEPSNIVTVHTLINDTFFDPNSHAAFNLGGATTSQVAAFDDNTTVLRNGSFLALLNRGQTANFTSAIDDVITADNPVVVAGRAGATGGNGNGGNIIWSVPYWAGRRFLFNGSRNGPHEIRVHAFENSTVDIIRGNITDATQVIAADDEHTFDLTNNASYEINSTGLIIVYGRSRNNGNTYYDPMPIMPASLRVLGYPSASGQLTALNTGTTYTNLNSDSNFGGGTATAGVTATITGTGSLFSGQSSIIEASDLVAVRSNADSNGLCSAPFIPTEFLKTRFMVNVTSQWVAFASLQGGTVAVTPPGGGGSTLNLTRTGGDNSAPFRAYLTNQSAGTLYESTVPMQVWYEPTNDNFGANNDETILFGF